MYEQREIVCRDMASRMDGAKREGVAEATVTIARKLINA